MIDLVVGALCVVVAVVFAVYDWQIVAETTYKVPGSGLFPFLVSIGLGLCGSFLMVQGWHRRSHPASVDWRALGIVVAGPALYFTALELIGFAVATGAFLVLTFRLLAWGRWALPIAVGVGSAALLNWIGQDLLHIPFPAGILWPE